MWLPDVITSAPALKISRAVCSVSPRPAAAFSPFTTTRSMRNVDRSSGMSCVSATRPGRPTTSPTISTRMSLAGDRRSPRLAYYRHPDFPRVLQRLLDLAGHIPREPCRAEVVDLFGPHDHAHLASGLNRERLVDAFEGVRDRLQRFQPP